MNIIVELTHRQLTELEAGGQKLFNVHGTHEIYWATAPRAAQDTVIATPADFEGQTGPYHPQGFAPDDILTADVHVFRTRQPAPKKKPQRR
jgi:hypothetical protein